MAGPLLAGAPAVPVSAVVAVAVGLLVWQAASSSDSYRSPRADTVWLGYNPMTLTESVWHQTSLRRMHASRSIWYLRDRRTTCR